mmetsp:Transcript_30258/g.69598  ORF Transcript_30258/g.69598 Transcript_30258/m.69598 type:complete len:205 (-) Transcript_30258:2059-2673(-)
MVVVDNNDAAHLHSLEQVKGDLDWQATANHHWIWVAHSTNIHIVQVATTLLESFLLHSAQVCSLSNTHCCSSLVDHWKGLVRVGQGISDLSNGGTKWYCDDRSVRSINQSSRKSVTHLQVGHCLGPHVGEHWKGLDIDQRVIQTLIDDTPNKHSDHCCNSNWKDEQWVSSNLNHHHSGEERDASTPAKESCCTHYSSNARICQT